MNTIDDKVLEGLNLGLRSEKSSNDGLGQEGFLKLMTAQLNNQDPTKPLESGEFFTQIAQFSSVSGIQELQNSFQQVASAMYSSQALQASAMVGRSVLVPSSGATYSGDNNITGSIDLPSSTSGLSMGVFDMSGQLIRRIDMGPQPGGVVQFEWNGMTDKGLQAPRGNYLIKAEARMGDETVALETSIAAKVESVSLGNNGQGVTLNLAGLGQIDLSNVKQVM